MAEVMNRSKAPTRRKAVSEVIEKEQLLEKDETEVRLERALFGDDAGFLDSLTQREQTTERRLVQKDGGEDAMSIDGEDDLGQDLGDIPDQDLFFLDAGTGDLPAAVRKHLETSNEEDNIHPRQPVWHDSDDDRITVSLASHTRLRKLRDTEDDDVVSGREYIARLRRQYERLHPTPEWLTYARKKRRTSNGGQNSASDSEADSDVSMSDSETTRSLQPLASLLRSAGSLTKSSTATTPGKRRKLRPEVIDISKLPPVATAGPSSIDSLQFHPSYPLLLTSGPSSTASLYHISPHPPNPNPLLTSLHLKNTPLHTTAFCTSPRSSDSTASDPTTDATRIILSSRRRYFHAWSLSTGLITKISRPLSSFKHTQRTTERFKISPSGAYLGLISSSRAGGGSINVLDSTTMSWICSARVDGLGGVADFDWWGQRSGRSRTGRTSDEELGDEGLTIVSKSGEVSEYSLSSRRIISRWHDEGAVGTTVLAISQDGRWVAIGSSSGIVNIYDRHAPSFRSIVDPPSASASASANIKTPTTTPTQDLISEPSRPSPTRALSNLTTPISALVFSTDSQMLVLASRWKKAALRLVHLPSCTVYKNWPTEKTNLGRISSVAVSPDGGVLAVGNERGAVRLWEIRE